MAYVIAIVSNEAKCKNDVGHAASKMNHHHCDLREGTSQSKVVRDDCSMSQRTVSWTESAKYGLKSNSIMPAIGSILSIMHWNLVDRLNLNRARASATKSIVNELFIGLAIEQRIIPILQTPSASRLLDQR